MEIKLKRIAKISIILFIYSFIFIDFSVNDSQNHKLDDSLYTTFAILIQDETCKPSAFSSFHNDMLNWKNELRKMLKSDTELVLIDPVTSANVKVFLGPKELKNGAHVVLKGSKLFKLRMNHFALFKFGEFQSLF